MTKYHDDLFGEADKLFKEIDKVFKDMEKTMVGAEAQVNDRLYKWEAYRSWLPRKVGKRWYWPGRLLYRKFVIREDGQHWYWKYGTEFDVLKDSK